MGAGVRPTAQAEKHASDLVSYPLRELRRDCDLGEQRDADDAVEQAGARRRIKPSQPSIRWHEIFRPRFGHQQQQVHDQDRDHERHHDRIPIIAITTAPTVSTTVTITTDVGMRIMIIVFKLVVFS